MALHELKRPADAVASFDAAIALLPAWAERYNNRGLALRDLRRHDEAFASHETAVALKPDRILLPLNPEWRWLLDRSDSPWYPSARLFRQSRATGRACWRA